MGMCKIEVDKYGYVWVAGKRFGLIDQNCVAAKIEFSAKHDADSASLKLTLMEDPDNETTVMTKDKNVHIVVSKDEGVRIELARHHYMMPEIN